MYISDIELIFKELDNELMKIEKSYNLYVCGGAAMQLLGYENRQTQDVDVLSTAIDEDLFRASKNVSKKYNLSEYWLNNRVSELIRKLPDNWVENSVIAYSGKYLSVYVISRQDLINSKLLAAINRLSNDEADLIFLRPNEEELQIAKSFCIKNNKYLPEVVVDALIESILGSV